jgi:hypothetical protein
MLYVLHFLFACSVCNCKTALQGTSGGCQTTSKESQTIITNQEGSVGFETVTTIKFAAY